MVKTTGERFGERVNAGGKGGEADLTTAKMVSLGESRKAAWGAPRSCRHPIRGGQSYLVHSGVSHGLIEIDPFPWRVTGFHISRLGPIGAQKLGRGAR